LTIESYSNLAIFYFSKLEKDRAIYYLFKSIYLSSFAFGEAYPETIVNRMHLSAVYQECAQYQLAILTLMDTVNGVIRVYGRNNVNTAVCYQALAALHYDINDLRQTIEFQDMAVEIFKLLLRENDGRLT
jgi:tetratricopeptide (TPR) repeat protein